MLLEREVVIGCPEGLHARPAASVVRIANGYSGNITLYWRDKSIEAKSILGILSSGIGCGELVRIAVDGEDAAGVMDDLERLLTAGEGI